MFGRGACHAEPELREKPEEELGRIVDAELATLNRLREKVLVGDSTPGKN